MMTEIKKFLKNNYFYIIIISLALCIRITNVFAINVVDGQSMYPTLSNGQIVIGSSIKKIERGDIVVAKTDKLVIKRIIGLPGETIKFQNGELYINGSLYEEEYLNEDFIKDSKMQNWEYQCKENEYLILGDNRDNSYDGRFYGPLPEERIKEKIYLEF